MTSERWSEIDRLFHAALDQNPAERAAFLDRACAGDDVLRREVESLLGHEGTPGGFLELPALQHVARQLTGEVDVLLPDPQIHGYTILKILGEGGMGIVYLAEQVEPFHRQVALKLIKHGMDTRQVIARFEVERQALAQMRHPSIAAVFDAGTTADGRPYFVMEYVDGAPITDYCDRHRLSTRARLGLFTDVCAAVQHAHQKGVIHRDLKPSNVLVSEDDGRPLPKIIDFGVAKAIDRSSTSPTAHTEQGTMVGTPEYMSPEQAALSPDIDTATDVYSLGVLLYELLVGALPFDPKMLREAGYDEMRRVIRESDPPKPSSRLTGAGVTADAAAVARHTEAGRLTRELKGDLDWITLKALEKDRRQRYMTVAALSADVARYLADEPIDARRPSAAYRARQFARRYRAGVIGAAAVFLVMAGGLIASLTEYERAERQSVEADRQRAQANVERAAAQAAARTAADERNAAVLASNEANRQQEVATNAAAAATEAGREAEFSAYASTIVAADGELRLNLASAARDRLLAVPVELRGWEWQHLFLKTDTSLATLASTTPCARPHEETQFPVTLSDKVVALDDGGARIYLKRCATLEVWDGPGHAHATYQAPGKILAVAPSGETLTAVRMAFGPNVQWALRLVDPVTGSLLRQVGPFEAEPICADINRDATRLAVGFMPQFNQLGEPLDDVFDVREVRTGERLFRLAPQKPPRVDARRRTAMSCMVAFSPDSTRIATSGATVHVWRLDSGGEMAADGTQAGTVSQPIAWTHSGSRLAIGRLTGLVDILDLTAVPRVDHLDGGAFVRAVPIPDDVDRRHYLETHKVAEVLSVAFSPDDARVVTGTGVGVGVWDVSQMRLTQVLSGHRTEVVGVAVDGTGRIISADAGGQVKVWSASASGSKTVVPGSVNFADFAVSANGAAVGLGQTDGGLFAWRLADLHRTVLRGGSGYFDRSRPLPPGVPSSAANVRALAMSADGRYLLAAEQDAVGTVRTWSLDSGTSAAVAFNANPVPDCKIRFGIDPGYLFRMAVSPDGRSLAFRQGNCLVVRDLSTSAVLATMHNFDSDLPFFFRPDGLLVAMNYQWILPGSTSTPTKMLLWDWRKNQVVAEAPTPPMETEFARRDWEATMSADGRRIALVGGNPTVVSIWDKDLRRELGRLPVPADTYWVALSADGKRLASTTASDMTVRIWDVERRQLLLILTDDDRPRRIVFTPDGRLIAERSSGGLTIWETKMRED